MNLFNGHPATVAYLRVPSHRFDKSGTTAFEPTCMIICGWRHYRARTIGGAAAAPSVLALSCDALRTRMELSRPPRSPDRHDKTFGECVVFFGTTPCWSPESEHRPKARRPTTETPTFSRFGSQQHYLSCYVNAMPGGPWTP